MTDFMNALALGTRARRDREELDMLDRRRALGPQVGAALGGNRDALGKIAAEDADLALKITPILDRMDAAQRERTKAGAEFTYNASNAVLQANPTDRPMVYRQLLEQGARMGFDLKHLPAEYTPQMDGQLRTYRQMAIPVLEQWRKEQKGAGAPQLVPLDGSPPAAAPAPRGVPMAGAPAATPAAAPVEQGDGGPGASPAGTPAPAPAAQPEVRTLRQMLPPGYKLLGVNGFPAYDKQGRLAVQAPDGTKDFIDLDQFKAKPPAKPEPIQKMTDGQATSALYADRMLAADEIINRVETAALNPAGKLLEKLPLIGNYLQPEEYQLFEQARRDFINAVLRRESGAVISDQEFINAEKQYFARPGDSAAVLKQKAANRRTAIEGLKRAAGPAYRQPQAAPAAPPQGARPPLDSFQR